MSIYESLQATDPVSLVGNIAQNWKSFEEQLHWFLAGTETASISDKTKIRIMLSHAGKEVRKVYKALQRAAEGDEKKFDNVTKAFQSYCEPRKTFCTSVVASETYSS